MICGVIDSKSASILYAFHADYQEDPSKNNERYETGDSQPGWLNECKIHNPDNYTNPNKGDSY